MGGIGIGGGAVGSRHDRGWNEENDSEGRKGRFQNGEVALYELDGLRTGVCAFRELFFEPATARLNILIQYI